MNASVRESYLETQVATATPQRLRLMLIDAALRQARLAEVAWTDQRHDEGREAASRCREIISELIAGIQPDQNAIAKQVLGVYLFLFSSLTEAQLTRDVHQLAGIIRVLEEEQQTWQTVCSQFPEPPSAALAAKPNEELAPQQIASATSPVYGPVSSHRATPSSFSIDA
jgi:flagellar protein FliS